MSNRVGHALATAGLLLACLAGGAPTSPAASGDGPYLGPADPRSTWVTSRPKAKSIVWAVGDGADGGQSGRAVAAMLGARRLHRLIYLGDVYPSGTAADFQNAYAPLFGRFARITAPVIGNHEWAERANGYIPYWSAAHGPPVPLRYAFSVSGWQVLALNSNAAADPAQLEWLRARIGASPEFGTCRIAAFHHPRFSASAAHGDTPAVEPLWADLAGHTRIAISGNDHDSQRLHPSRGITQFVAGAGGNTLYAMDPGDTRLAFGDDAHFAALKLALTPGRAVASFVSSDGELLDRSEHRCKQGRG